MTKKLLITFSVFVSFFALTEAQSYKYGFKFAKFIDYLDSYYVDSIDAEKMVEEAIEDILSELDPHSKYIPADQLKKMREPLQGNFEGIGVSFNILKDTLYVVEPIAGGPSDMVGIKAGDKIVKIDGENVAGIGLTNDDVFSKLKGPKGTKVNVSILRRNEKKLLDFLIIRDKIPIFSLDASYKINETTGYIKIRRFSLTTIEEFKAASQELLASGATNLVLDLTNNGGGYLDAAVKLADEFLEEKRLVVYTEGLNSPRRDYLASTYGQYEDAKIIILIDEGSASASEIVTGAVQDWDKGIIIGRRSFGKGLVQREMLLPDESAVRITTARYFTPSGRLIQKPFDEGLEKYQMEVYERFSNGELQTEDSIHLADSLKFKTMVQGRTVYGGGGIMPDIFVPFDTSFYSDYYRDIMRKGILNQFTLEYVDKNREKIKGSYPNFNSFEKEFSVDQKLLDKLTLYAEKEGVEKNDVDFQVSKVQIQVMIKALIARDVFENKDFYKIYNTIDNTYLKALEVLNNWDSYLSQVF